MLTSFLYKNPSPLDAGALTLELARPEKWSPAESTISLLQTVAYIGKEQGNGRLGDWELSEVP